MLLPLNVASMPTEAETGKTVRGIVLEVCPFGYAVAFKIDACSTEIC